MVLIQILIRGGGDDDNVKIVSIEYSSDKYNATVTLNKEVTMDDVINHLTIFGISEIAANDTSLPNAFVNKRCILEYSEYKDSQLYISNDRTKPLHGFDYKITLNGNKIFIEDASYGHAYELSTICWL